MIGRRSYVVELHDVHPSSLPDVERMLETLSADARRVAAALVVPNWSGCERLTADSLLARRIASLMDGLVLHGLTHVRGRNWWNTAWHGTADESECLSWSHTIAQSRLAEGLDVIESAFGCRPRWFCAPRWQQHPDVAAVLAECRIDWHMRRSGFVDARGRECPVPAIWFDGGLRVWQRAATGAWAARRLRRHLASGEPFRLALHPRDVQHRTTWATVTSLLARLEAEGWTPVGLGAVDQA
jgi:predicted deacetylase